MSSREKRPCARKHEHGFAGVALLHERERLLRIFPSQFDLVAPAVRHDGHQALAEFYRPGDRTLVLGDVVRQVADCRDAVIGPRDQAERFEV